MSRLIVLLYGVVSYLIGVIGLVAIIVVLAGFMSWGFLHDGSYGSSQPIVWNSLLVLIWAVLHTGMARPSFKAMLTKLIPESAERPTYVLVAGLTSVALVGYWALVPGQVWHVEAGWGVVLLWGLFGFGWVFLLASTFAINHFDLFGLRQVYLNYKKMPATPVQFVKRAMYQYVRHPIQTGVLIGVWATPLMTTTQLVLSIGFTVYILVGLWFEERDLIAEHGDEYTKYRDQVGKLFPKITGSK
ncbi:MAG: protein-S-isoprenylcysteine O-methyltransferase Ste14 [Arenicella sp.]|jgi:protein-S-isoprenylcysteine O-methyltransferase Ste14